MTRARFEQLVTKAVKDLPQGFKKKMENIAIVVEDWPSREILSSMGIRRRNNLLGLYQGVPYPRRGFDYGNVLPDKITIYQRPIESLCRTDHDVKRKIQEVVIHEIGHYFGLTEQKLGELEENINKY
ncbi:MAG TPA: metallopeptidase family protein [Syntrophaceae bacterium]|nr:metallopeptidase family protein [Syntrophaceae bacterium]